MKKSVIMISVLVIVVLVLSFLIGTGFVKRTDVMLVDYSVSTDGTKLTFKTAVPTSMGYIRGFEDNGVKSRYLTFYSTFGGLNSSFDAKNEFEMDLTETDTEIYFNRPNDGYALVLKKNAETDEWEEP